MTATVGIMLPRDIPAEQFVPFARAAEAAGFDELWVVEDLFFRGGVSQAAVVLASTARIAVGIGILPAAARNAAFATLEIATLAELYPGRVQVGIGHGVPSWMRQVGAWSSSPLTVLRETLDAVRRLLRGDTLTVDGQAVALDAAMLESAPASPPPVFAGVRGPRSLEVAGAHADGTILAEPVAPEYLAAVLASVNRGRAAASEGSVLPARHHIVAYALAAVRDDAAEARSIVRPSLERAAEPDWSAHIDPLPFAGELRALRNSSADGAEFARKMPDDWVDQLAVVGIPEDARGRIRELHEAGANSVVLIPTGANALKELAEFARVL